MNKQLIEAIVSERARILIKEGKSYEEAVNLACEELKDELLRIEHEQMEDEY